MCPPIFIFNNQYINQNDLLRNNQTLEEARKLLKEVLLKWAENHTEIFAILESEWIDEEAQVEELLKLKHEAEKLLILVKNDIKP